MEKKQSELCFEILKRFHRAGILKDFVLIGSWCVYFYKEYFPGSPYISQAVIKTRDIDFLVGDPGKIKKEVDIPELLKDLGFVTIFKGDKGYIKLDHPELILEFLVPEKGRGIDKPYSLRKLGVNAVALRFLDFLLADTIKVKSEDFVLTLLHPANFALHKLIIFQRRSNREKAVKDKNAALDVLKALIEKGEMHKIEKTFVSVPPKWRKKILKGLEESGEEQILHILRNSA